MAKRKANTARAQAGSTGDSMEKRILAFAEQLGRVAGTVQAKAEGWLDREALNAQIANIRDTATDLLQQIGATASSAAGKSGGQARGAAPDAMPNARPKTASPGTAPAAASKRPAGGKQAAAPRGASTTHGAAKMRAAKSGGGGRSGGTVDAPGKKHRGPMPAERGAASAPRGDGARLAKLKAANMNRTQRRG
jgi:hypothetical protein